MKLENVSIRFQPGAYGVYRSLNNQIWYALGEFVDNGVQSYIANKEALKNVDGKNYQLEIDIEINLSEDFIKISDNAAGIDNDNFLRAFEPANIPTDNTGLSEFGMGMKIASIWFADEYEVKSKALNEDFTRTVVFNLDEVTSQNKEVLKVENQPSEKKTHFTVVTLRKLSHNKPSPSHLTLQKIKDHISSIYRKFINSNELKLSINGDALQFDEPAILEAPYVEDPEGDTVFWKKEVFWEAGKYKVSGYIGLLEKMSNIHSGLSLFRRGRIIEGSHNLKYHPKVICGSPGSPRDKRIFGDLELEGFNVSFEKGKFLDTSEFDIFLNAIKDFLINEENNILKQGDRFRKGKTKKQKANQNKKIKDNLEKRIKHQVVDLMESDFKNSEVEQESILNNQEPNQVDSELIEYEVTYERSKYLIEISLKNEPSSDDLYIVYPIEDKDGISIVRSIINLEHIFFEQFLDDFKNHKNYSPIVEIFRNLIFAEVVARKTGLVQAGMIRKKFNFLISQN
jgi:hypothetical protein